MSRMALPTVARWSREEEPSEARLRAIMVSEGMEPYAWSNGPGCVYTEHEHPYHKVLYVVRGSIRFIGPEGQVYDLQPGDRLELPARTRHSAYVGEKGVLCLEAQRP